MLRRSNILVVGLCVVGWSLAACAVAEEPAEAKSDDAPAVLGTVTEVTFYRGQALVTRSIPLEDGKGSQEVVVRPLPEQIVPDSLFAESGDGVEIRAVRFRSRAVGRGAT